MRRPGAVNAEVRRGDQPLPRQSAARCGDGHARRQRLCARPASRPVAAARFRRGDRFHFDSAVKRRARGTPGPDSWFRRGQNPQILRLPLLANGHGEVGLRRRAVEQGVEFDLNGFDLVPIEDLGPRAAICCCNSACSGEAAGRRRSRWRASSPQLHIRHAPHHAIPIRTGGVRTSVCRFTSSTYLAGRLGQPLGIGADGRPSSAVRNIL